ncbi:coproporphyrinogen-III oxidase aerobic [Candidatus Rickettsiella viridis]|uniref:Oxygen-dependent coproporphyrinogen-III oxidase n=1 Tax=Candidatus Rickettsiella viridis TaxID=676208 RepID=A0A2Z5UWJ0_9COXI|nr:oxygen-dependent coproporphyrinogen oxidase [Candidatus Rickettsiella viridis]BBB15401.1 coproporphyrinogen-III oxidase aerobic [Candidatus Rickettsiella viridis]
MNYELIIPEIKDYLLQLQTNICFSLETEDSQQTFIADHWLREEGGGGKTCVLAEGAVIERGAVNFSHISGAKLPPSATARHPQFNATPFQALGLSLVIHPQNPYVPAVHMNLRFITLQRSPKETPVWWFGGGFDLTPYYPFLEDCQYWHTVAKAACDPFGEALYLQYKKNCDEYFYLKHRKESRGIGGLFFDDLNHWDFQTCFQFVQSIGDHFLKAYLPIMQRHKDKPYGERERQFQAYRRSRYVEFNLIYDRGTLFGLQSGGRVESILISMPPVANWKYNWQPEAGSAESTLTEQFLVPRDWV